MEGYGTRGRFEGYGWDGSGGWMRTDGAERMDGGHLPGMPPLYGAAGG